MNRGSQFTGRPRPLGTRWSVRWADRSAQALIVVGGLGTIAAVSLVGCFLVWVVLPLFLPATVSQPAHGALPWGQANVRMWGASEGGELGWALADDGRLLHAEVIEQGGCPVGHRVDGRKRRSVRAAMPGKIERQNAAAAEREPARLQEPHRVIHARAMQEYDDGFRRIEGNAAGRRVDVPALE